MWHASHRADQVEEVVFVAYGDQLPKHAELLARLSPHSLRLGRVVPVLPVGPAGSLQAFWCSRPGAEPAMHATPPVRHCRLAARLAIALAPGSTSASCLREVEMGSPAVVLRFIGHFSLDPPRLGTRLRARCWRRMPNHHYRARRWDDAQDETLRLDPIAGSPITSLTRARATPLTDLPPVTPRE